MKFLGDIIVVEPLEKTVVSDTIVVPETVREGIKHIKAKVIAVGIVRNRKSGRYYAGDDLKPNDTVLVPSHLGSRNRVPDNPKAIIYDSEDIVATFV